MAVSGVSMGGWGACAWPSSTRRRSPPSPPWSPAIESSLTYAALTAVDTFYRQDVYIEKFGMDGEVDAAYWAENNPATIA